MLTVNTGQPGNNLYTIPTDNIIIIGDHLLFIQSRYIHLKINTSRIITAALVIIALVALPGQIAIGHAYTSDNKLVLCGTGIRNHVALNGRIDISFCISHDASLKVLNVSYSYTVNGTDVTVQLYLNRTETQHYTEGNNGSTVNVTETHEWWAAEDILPPDSNSRGVLTVEYSGGTDRIPVQPGYIPRTTVYISHTQYDIVPYNLPLIVTAIIAIALLALIKALI